MERERWSCYFNAASPKLKARRPKAGDGSHGTTSLPSGSTSDTMRLDEFTGKCSEVMSDDFVVKTEVSSFFRRKWHVFFSTSFDNAFVE